MLLVRGVLQGHPSAQRARELGLTEQTVVQWRHRLPAHAEQLQPTPPLPDRAPESDAMVQHAGKKSDEHCAPTDAPRCRANKRRGRGTSATDRPPIVGTVGRATGHVRLRVGTATQGTTLREQVQQCTGSGTQVSTAADERSHRIARTHSTVTHRRNAGARDDDGAGMREGHTKTSEGRWAGVRTFLRVLRGVHKRYLRGSGAIHELHVNLKVMSVSFIAALVALH